MHVLRDNLRVITVVLAAAVVAVAASSLAPAPKTLAAVTDPTGVICGRFTGMTLNGDAFYTGTFGMALARIDYDPPDAIVTAVAYLDTAPTGDPNLTWPDCKTAQASPPNGAIEPNTKEESRPSVFGTYASKTIGGSTCQSSFSFGTTEFPGFTKVTPSISVATGANGVTGTFEFEGEYADEDCTTPVGTLATWVASFTGTYHDGPDAGVSTFNSDWDKDSCLDWNELAVYSQFDPFKDDCSAAGGVGGVAEIVDAPGAALAAESSGGSWPIAIVAGAALAGVLGLGGGLAYARRRSR